MLKKLEIIIAILMLGVAVGFNLWLYRAEPTALADPNDNAFQYALVERTNEIWDFAKQACPKNLSYTHCLLSYLTDHWVPNWAEGYNLPYYYSHVPQILIVGSYRLFSPLTAIFNSQFSIFNSQLSTWLFSPLIPIFNFQLSTFNLFTYYHVIIYLLLCFFPLSIFLSLKILKQPWLTAGIGALLASHISTDGLYGLDPSSFLWRGWGLSSQLFAMTFMPLAIAWIIRFMIYDLRFRNKNLKSYFLHLKSRLPAIFFITATTMGHLGMGMMLFLAIPVVALTKPLLTILKNENTPFTKNVVGELKEAAIKTIILALPPLLLLSYWILPTIVQSQYHNISFWDPIWKFNSYGAKEVMTNFFNGNLFDFGRLPIFTALILIGLFVSFSTQSCITPLPFLFLFFLLLYFGRTTWGNILNIIPGMDEFHQHRFVVGIHLIGLLLAPIGFAWVIEQIVRIARFMMYDLRFTKKSIHKSYIVNHKSIFLLTILCLGLVLALLFPRLYTQTISYGKYNETLIKNANKNFEKDKDEAQLLVQTLKKAMEKHPGRVFAGRGGAWGKQLRIAETPYFMYLSTYGIPTILWLPQTWSMNSDTEQYFSEDNESHYILYNVSYAITPINQKPQPFWRLIKESTSWKLYEITGKNVNTPSQQNNDANYITIGSSPSVVFSNKQYFGNVVSLWIQSDYPKKQLFPELRLKTTPSPQETLPHFSMVDEATYQTPDRKLHSLFGEPPLYMTPWEWPDAFKRIAGSAVPAGLSALDPLPITVTSQSSDADMVFKTTVVVEKSCPTCVVVLKQTYHSNWQVTVNGKTVKPIIVFPFFTAVRLENPGTYDIVFSYKPSGVKQILLWGAILGSISACIFLIKHHYADR